MTTTPDKLTSDRTTADGLIIDAWSETFAIVLETMIGARPEIVAAHPPHEQDAAGDLLLWWKQGYDLPGGAHLSVGFRQPDRAALGHQALVAAGVDDADEQTALDTCQELLQQAFSGLAQAIGSHLGREVLPTEGAETGAPDTKPTLLEIRFESLSVTHALSVSPELRNALEPTMTTGAEGPVSAFQTTVGPAGENHEAPAPAKSKTLDLLLDVELPVSISFGRAHLPLKDVLKLTSGSIVELNRAVAEPVEIIVNNCVIARGEVVVVEGNYGVRISEIISREERLRTLN